MEDAKPLPDERVVSMIRAGDDDAAAGLFGKYLPLLRWRVRQRLPEPLRRKVAESDIIQEAYLGAIRRLSEFEDRGPGSFGAWIGTIIDRRVSDQVRRYMGTDKRNALLEISQPENGQPQAAGSDLSVDIPARRAEAMRCVHAALGDLSGEDRRVIDLVHFQGQSLRAAAEVIGIGVNAARMRYGRALTRLKRHMISASREYADGP